MHMDSVQATGSQAVATLLRHLADGAEEGTILLSGRLISCPADLTATVEVPHADSCEEIVISLRFAGQRIAGRPVALEEELAHPGG